MLSARKSSGIAAVEFLIVLPVLLLILTLIVEFGNAFVRYNTLNKMVQNAARYSVVDIYGSEDVDSIADLTSIQNMVLYGRKTPIADQLPVLDSIQVEINEVVDGGISYVVVTASYPYQPIMNLISIDALTNLQLTSSAVMRVSP